ncbi:hypothetical protein SEA_CHILIPEPPER_36 [Microbacterium phage ChiliPepper]|nr:hypothetical protein SEA_CHILIPEPPER_36 [Microbacterium phage ChiliPepper]
MSMTEPMNDAALPGLMSVDPVEVVEPQRLTEFQLVARKRPKDGWNTAKQVCRSFDHEFLEGWAAEANEKAGWAEYKVL